MSEESGIGQHEPADEAQFVGSKPRGTHLTSGEGQLIKVQGIYQAANSIAGIFLSLYLFQVGGFESVCIFYATNYTVQSFAFLASGRLLKTWATNQLTRIGLTLLSLVFFLLLLLGEQAVHYVALLGLLAGIGDGIYWSNINTSEYVSTHEGTRNIYYSKLFFANSLGSVMGPPVAGIILTISDHTFSTTTGYYILFALLIATWMTTQFQAKSMVSLTGSRFELRHMVDKPRTLEWKLILLQNFLRGLWVQPLISFSAVLLFLIVDSELTLSFVSVVTTLITGAVSLKVGKVLQRHPSTYWLGATIVPLGMIGFALQQNWFGIFCWAILIQCFDLFGNTSTFKVMYDVMDREDKPWSELYHLVAEREAVLNLGRLVGFGAVYFAMGTANDAHAVAVAVGVAAIFPLLTGIIHHKLINR